jgi:sugar phosphate permease
VGSPSVWASCLADTAVYLADIAFENWKNRLTTDVMATGYVKVDEYVTNYNNTGTVAGSMCNRLGPAAGLQGFERFQEVT